MARRAPDELTGGVLLRDATEGDLPALFEQRLDPAANQMAAFTNQEEPRFYD